MLQQTTDQLRPLLSLLQQPAFCVSRDGGFFANRSAQGLMPGGREDLELWLGKSRELWADWDHSTALELPLELGGRTCTLTIEPLSDGDLFLLSSDDLLDQAQNALSTASQVLRQPLSDLSMQVQFLSRQLQRTEQNDLLDQVAAMNRQLYRLTRISSNLSDLETLRTGQYHVRLQLLELNTWLREKMEEAQDLCRSMNRTLLYTPAQKSVSIYADPALLERAIYNLLSNALKYGAPDAPITCSAELTDTQVLFRVQNLCAEGNTELLRAAFTRLQQRDTLPDPRWGVGLGLPLVLAIAKLHGGAAAVEAIGKDTACVTLSLPRRRPFQTPGLENLPPFEYSGGMRRSMLELSDCLPNSVFHPDAI